MSTKLKQWGAAFLSFGIVAIVLPQLTGMQLRIFNLFGENSRAVAIAAVALGVVMWLLGAATGSGSSQAVAASAGSAPAPPPNAGPASPRTCSQCGTTAGATDSFCMQCGTALTTARVETAPVVVPVTSARPRRSFGRKCFLFVLLVIVAGGAWLFFGGIFGAYNAPPRSEPSVPQRIAGTLTEFPVDSAQTNRMEPIGVVSQTFEPPTNGSPPLGSGPTVAQQNALPPGIDTNSIPRVATTMTSATYRCALTASAPINVSVLQPTRAGLAQQFAQGIAQTAGGQMQSARLQSPQGQTYEGYSVRSSSILVYVLTNMSAGTVIIIYSPQPSGFDAAQRLAGNVGNGRGIRDYPKVADTFGALPAAPPPGYQLSNLVNFSGNQLTSSLNQFQGTVDPEMVKALAQVIKLVRLLIPEHGIVAQYRNPQGQQKGALIGNYGSKRQASFAFRLVSWTFGFAMKKTTAPGFEALQYSDRGGKIMVFQKGPYIGLTHVPPASSEAELADFARSLQF